MKHAQESRTFTRKQKMDPKTTSKMIGNLFVRSFDQSERIYMAMLARGYDPDDRD
jgi:energy-coupling factor transporter transmembrane protein EcfT